MNKDELTQEEARESLMASYAQENAALKMKMQLAERDRCRLVSNITRAHNESQALKEQLQDWEDGYAKVVGGRCAADEVHCSCVPHLRKEIAALEARGDAHQGSSTVHLSGMSGPEWLTSTEYDALFIEVEEDES